MLVLQARGNNQLCIYRSRWHQRWEWWLCREPLINLGTKMIAGRQHLRTRTDVHPTRKSESGECCDRYFYCRPMISNMKVLFHDCVSFCLDSPCRRLCWDGKQQYHGSQKNTVVKHQKYRSCYCRLQSSIDFTWSIHQFINSCTKCKY